MVRFVGGHRHETRERLPCPKPTKLRDEAGRELKHTEIKRLVGVHQEAKQVVCDAVPILSNSLDVLNLSRRQSTSVLEPSQACVEGVLGQRANFNLIPRIEDSSGFVEASPKKLLGASYDIAFE